MPHLAITNRTNRTRTPPRGTFHDTWTEALIHKLATCVFAALQVLAHALGGPFSGLIVAATYAELDELCHGMLLLVVVVGLHQGQLLAILAAALAVLLAVVAVLQLDDPDALTGGAAVLLDHARLKRHGLLEASRLQSGSPHTDRAKRHKIPEQKTSQAEVTTNSSGE